MTSSWYRCSINFSDELLQQHHITAHTFNLIICQSDIFAHILWVNDWVRLTASVVHTCKGNWITCTLTVPQNLFECLRNENNMHGHKGYIKGIEVLESYIYLGNIFDLWEESVRTYTYLHLRIQVEELFPFRVLVYVTYTQFPQQSCSNYMTKRIRAMFFTYAECGILP